MTPMRIRKGELVGLPARVLLYSGTQGGESMSEWIMASDRMPDPHGDDVLMYYEWTGKSGTV